MKFDGVDDAYVLDGGFWVDTLVACLYDETCLCFADVQEWVWVNCQRNVTDDEISAWLLRASKFGELPAVEDVVRVLKPGRTPITNGVFLAVYESSDTEEEAAQFLSLLSGAVLTEEYVATRMELHRTANGEWV